MDRKVVNPEAEPGAQVPLLPKVTPERFPALRLATTVTAGTFARGVPRFVDPPSMLISYAFLDRFATEEAGQFLRHARSWVLDSGAFTASTTGRRFSVENYIEKILWLLMYGNNDRLCLPPLVEVFALDVIGDWEAGLRNTRRMWQAGIRAIPTWHPGEPIELLRDMAQEFPKIAVGGVVGKGRDFKRRVLDTLFSTVWPKRIHALGITDEQLLWQYPFHSADSSTWEHRPRAFGDWKSFGRGLSISFDRKVRGEDHPQRLLMSEVAHYTTIERRLQNRWANEMARLEAEA